MRQSNLLKLWQRKNGDRVLDPAPAAARQYAKLPKGLVITTLLACAAMSLPVLAQVTGSHTVYLWDGTGGTETGVKTGAWGNGDYELLPAAEGRGQDVLEVRTRNFYEGVRFSFARPLPLNDYRSSGLLRVRLRSEKARDLIALQLPGPQGAMQNSSPGYNPYQPGSPGMPSGNPYMPNPAGGPGFNPNMPNQMGSPGMGPGGALAVLPPVVSSIQIVMHLERGALFGQFKFNEDSVRPDARGWQSFVVPLSQMRATPNASGGLKTVVISGDREGLFELGQLALVPQTNSRAISIRRPSDPVGTQQTELQVAPGPLRLVADVETGSTDVVVSWNFDAGNTGSLPEPPDDIVPLTAPSSPGSSNIPGTPAYDPSRPPTMPNGGRFGTGGMPRPSGMPRPTRSPSSGASIEMLPERLDARGLTAQVEMPNEEQDYNVEVTVRDRATMAEVGKAVVLVKVRSVE